MGLSLLRRIKNIELRHKHHDKLDESASPFLLHSLNELNEDDLFEDPSPAFDDLLAASVSEDGGADTRGAAALVSPPVTRVRREDDTRLATDPQPPPAAAESDATDDPAETAATVTEASVDNTRELASSPRRTLSLLETPRRAEEGGERPAAEGGGPGLLSAVKKGVTGAKMNRRKKEKRKKRGMGAKQRSSEVAAAPAEDPSQSGRGSGCQGWGYRGDRQNSPPGTFLRPPKKDTALISPESQYRSHILLLEEEKAAEAAAATATAAGVEMELSSEISTSDAAVGAAGEGRAGNGARASPPSAGAEEAVGGDAGCTARDDLVAPVPAAADGCIDGRDAAAVAGPLSPPLSPPPSPPPSPPSSPPPSPPPSLPPSLPPSPLQSPLPSPPPPPPGPPPTRDGGRGTPPAEGKKRRRCHPPRVPDTGLLTRLRKIGGARPGAAPAGRDAPPAGSPGGVVPQFIDNDEGASMPSLLTEPELAKKKKERRARAAAKTLTSAPRRWADVGDTSDLTGGGPVFGLSAASSEGLTTAASTASSATPTSTATRTGGIERLLGLLQCGEDVTAIVEAPGLCGVRGLHDVLNCGRSRDAEVDAVYRALEEEELMALDFHRDIIKNGIKLIYHESPSKNSPNPDWIQSTIKLFLRPGNCHTNLPWSCQQPTLTWAVLPVVSRMQVTRSFDSSEESLWSHLGLLDVHSILMDEGGDDDNAQEEKDGLHSAPSITGFFSVTATNGAVYVFEAPSVKQRDYVVLGLRAVIARLTHHLVAGNATVIGEMFNNEDAGQLTGELPSLVSPVKALGRVTNMFLDQL